MGYTAVLHFVGNLSKVQFIIKDKLLYLLNFMADNELLNGNAFYFRENIGKISVIVIKLLTDVFRILYYW